MNFLDKITLLFLITAGITTKTATETIKSMEVPTILITNPTVPTAGQEILEESGCKVIVTANDTKEAILDKISGVDAVFWATKVKLDKEILDKAGPKMKVVGTMSAGYNHIDVDELTKRGIKLGNTPRVLNDAVADIAVLLTLGAARRMHEGRMQMELGLWELGLNWLLGQDIQGSTVGIVGLGGIGQTIVKRLKAFNVKQFLYTGHREKPEGKELGAKFVSFDELVRTSDFVIAAVPLTNETTGLFNEEVFNKMKRTAVFVNISRGAVVKQEDLIKALKENRIFAAGLDVMTPEPIDPSHELLKLPNCVLMPHLGSATLSTRTEMAKLTAQNILRGLGGAEMITPVN